MRLLSPLRPSKKLLFLYTVEVLGPPAPLASCPPLTGAARLAPPLANADGCGSASGSPISSGPDLGEVTLRPSRSFSNACVPFVKSNSASGTSGA